MMFIRFGDEETTWVSIELADGLTAAGRLRLDCDIGPSFLRLDIPKNDGVTYATHFFSAAFVHRVSVVTEEYARLLNIDPRPTEGVSE